MGSVDVVCYKGICKGRGGVLDWEYSGRYE